jgi:hypothetical protein
MNETRILDWTYELPPAGDGATGLEDYVVRDSHGEHVGKVSAILRHSERLFVAVEHGTPPLKNELVAIPWENVREVDHDNLTVGLALSPGDIEKAPRLDQARKASGSEIQRLDATRETDIPGAPVGTARPTAERGPVDRSSYAVAVCTGILGVFALFVLVIFASGMDFTWHFALAAIPVTLLAFSGLLAYRTFRNPYARR